MFRHTGVKPSDIEAVTAGFEAMVENIEASYDYSAEPRVHQRVYSVLARSFGSLLNTNLASQGALHLMKLLSQNKAELEENVKTAR